MTESYRNFGNVRAQAWSANASDVNLPSLLGDNAFVVGVMVGSDQTDRIEFLVGTTVVYTVDADATTPVTVSGTRENAWLPWPIPVRVVDSTLGLTDVVVNVVATNMVSLLYVVR